MAFPSSKFIADSMGRHLKGVTFMQGLMAFWMANAAAVTTGLQPCLQQAPGPEVACLCDPRI